MTNPNPNTLSVNAGFDLEAKPDRALIRLHFTGEGMTLEDSVSTAQRKVSEAVEALKQNHPAIESIEVFDVYCGQKDERFRLETQSFPRPLVIHGVLIVTSPTDPSSHYRIVDEGVKRGALMENPQRRSYLTDGLNGAILYGLVSSAKHETEAIEGCLKEAANRAQLVATGAGKKLGKLVSIANVSVDPSVGETIRKDYSCISKSLPTRFLSPTPQKVIVSARLAATFELLEL